MSSPAIGTLLVDEAAAGMPAASAEPARPSKAARKTPAKPKRDAKRGEQAAPLSTTCG